MANCQAFFDELLTNKNMHCQFQSDSIHSKWVKLFSDAEIINHELHASKC